MGDCVPTPTATQFATEVDTTTFTTTLLRESTLVSIQTGSFPSTLCTGSGSNGCSVLIITYRITSTSTAFVPTATRTVISRVTDFTPQQTLFVPCTIADDGTPSGITLPNGVVTVTSVHIPSGQTQENNSGSSNTNRAATIGGVIAAVVTLSLSIIGFIMWTLWKKNRAMKAALEEHERKEDEPNMAQFLPTPYPFTPSPPGPSATVTASSPTPRPTLQNLSSHDLSSAHTRQQFDPGLLIPSMYSMSPHTDHDSDFTTNDIHTHTRTYSFRSSTAGSQTHSIAPSQLPGPSGVTTSGQPTGHQGISAGAEAKGREARMADGRLRAVNITEGVEGDPEHAPTALFAPPPAYSREVQ